MRMNINDFDEELWKKAEEYAFRRGCKSNNIKSTISYILSDYLHLCELDEIDNPLLLKKMQQITSAEINLMEKRLGGRLFSLVGDNTINLSILTQILFESVQKYDDTSASQMKLEQFRINAVDNLRNRKKPITYVQLVKDEEFDG